MKNIRTCGLGLLVALTLGVLPGCATTGLDSSVATDSQYHLEKKTPPSNSTADMNVFEKTGYYLGWVSLYALYAFAEGNPNFSP